ncbi:exosortase A [Allosphingosinicella indica]|uniref:Exosortase A n=1 Tax=Allosphingosinicella indica TaxID=941907 RepID=A0A1X7GWX8_9SPHN|nr:exosortase A [Allosphingosinicella indica]SMF75507.1 exosortase A [Allosphingosinicella indica]
MTIALPIRVQAVAEGGWRTHLVALGLLAGGILLLIARDAADMVRIWIDSSTFNHCMLLPPIIGWLVWQRLPELRQLTPVAWMPGLLIVGAGAAGWMLGEAGGVALARHAGLVLMLQGAVVALLGPAVARGLLFPLAFAFFLVPAGEEFVPLMQRVTAEICMWLLAIVGVPAHIEGVFISTPTGYFEVAEACAGVKFLIAMIALGALVANLCFRSWKRRITFLIAAVVIPILANGVRAFATIYVAHLTDVEAASGFDHVVYGWVFFAIVIALILGAGWHFFDRGIDDPWFDPAALQPVPPGRSPLKPVAAVAAALVLAPVAWTAAIAAGNEVTPPPLVLPDVAGWEKQVRGAGRAWAPHFAGADVLRVGHYRDAAGRDIDLAIAIFARQEEGREIVGFGQGAVAPEGAWAWIGAGPAPQNGRLERIASHGTVREVAIFYRVGDTLTGSPLAVKWETMKARLLGGPQRAVAILVSAEAPAEGISPRPAIDDFLRATGPLAPLADRAAGLPEG